MKRQMGFTLVELVVVIIILGILAATALPKFMNVTEDAHHAAVAGVAGSLGSGVSMVHAQWMANGLSDAARNIRGFGNDNVDVNAAGWPTGTRNSTEISSVRDCIDIWNGVMQNPPPVSQDRDKEYRATRSGQRCVYRYLADSATRRTITYDARTGEIKVNNP